MGILSMLRPAAGIILAALLTGGALPSPADGAGNGASAESPAAPTAAPASAPAPEDDGDRIVFGSIGEASNLIPWLASDSASHEVAGLIFVAPLRYSRNLEPEPWAAESFEEEDGGRLLRFRLRRGILWEDGRELTAEDVEFTYRLVIDPATASPYAEDFLRIREFRVLDRYTFEVRYDAYFARAVASWMNAILPKHLLEGQDIRSTPFARRPVGAGPYRLKAWEPGSRIVLEASPTYFLGKPHIAEVVYRMIPDTATMFMETRAGRLDVMSLTPEQYQRQAVGPVWEREFARYRHLASIYVFLGFNMRHPFFQDRRVRQAISHAISRDDIVRGVLLGEGVPAFGPFKPDSWASHPTLRPVPYDPEKARALLAEAGFADHDGDGIVDRDGAPLAFTILTNQGNEQRILCATVIQSLLKKVGVEVRIRTVEWAAFIHEFVDKGRFDAVILGWTISQDPDIYQVWHSSQAREGGLNFTRYVNPELDDLLERGRSTPDRAERKRVYDRVQELMHEEQPYCFLFVPNSLPVVQRRFRGVDPAPAGIMHNFDEWHVPAAEHRHAVTPREATR